jgi:hypothetical protein
MDLSFFGHSIRRPDLGNCAGRHVGRRQAEVFPVLPEHEHPQHAGKVLPSRIADDLRHQAVDRGASLARYLLDTLPKIILQTHACLVAIEFQASSLFSLSIHVRPFLFAERLQIAGTCRRYPGAYPDHKDGL